MLGYGLMTRDLPTERLDEFDELLDSADETANEPTTELERASVDDVQRFIGAFGGGEVTLVG